MAVRTPSPLGSRSLSADSPMTSRARRNAAPDTCSEEGWTDYRSRSHGQAYYEDPFRGMPGGKISTNFAKKLADAKDEAQYGVGNIMLDSRKTHQTTNRSASPRPAHYERFGRHPRQSYGVAPSQPIRKSDTVRTNEMLNTMLRNIGHLFEKVE